MSFSLKDMHLDFAQSILTEMGVRPVAHEGLRINNVIFAVRDLAATSERLLCEYGLHSTPVPYPYGITMHVMHVGGRQFLELMGSHDETSNEARQLAEVVETGDRVLQWEIRTDDIDAVARRLKRSPIERTYHSSDGRLLDAYRTIRDDSGWRCEFPPFVQYNLPGRVEPPELVITDTGLTLSGFAWIEVGGSESALSDWVGAAELPLRFIPGSPGPKAAAISSSEGEILLP